MFALPNLIKLFKGQALYNWPSNNVGVRALIHTPLYLKNQYSLSQPSASVDPNHGSKILGCKTQGQKGPTVYLLKKICVLQGSTVLASISCALPNYTIVCIASLEGIPQILVNFVSIK